MNLETKTTRPSAAVSEERLWRRHIAMAELGATAKGGVNRQALSPEDAAARRLLASWAEMRGFAVSTDAIGNLFVRRAGTDATAAPVLSGSHMDSQPTGGKFDGIYGVLAGFEALEALEEAGLRTKRPIEIVAWMNEEGSRFQPGAMGSAVFAGALELDAALAMKDRTGVSVYAALAETLVSAPAKERGKTGFPVAAYVEAHIEQGPRLEAASATIGVVTGIQGQRRFTIDVTGEEAHAGTTPRAQRRDALVAAVAIVAALQDFMADPADILRFTVGRFEVHPGAPNTVPGRAHFTIDLRHPDAAVLQERGDRITEIASRFAGGCSVRVAEVSHVPPTNFAPEVIGLVRKGAEVLGYRYMDMPSGAGHDAMHLARLAPTAMIFVPCWRGISHNEAESATPADLAAGARVLVDVLAELAQR